MKAQVGVAVSEILDRAADIYIKQNAPDAYEQFVWQVHGAGMVRHYDGSDEYWRRVQAALDSFFTAKQRGEICRCLMGQAALEGLPECRTFRALALAEVRLADLVAGVARTVGMRTAPDSVDRGCC